MPRFFLEALRARGDLVLSEFGGDMKMMINRSFRGLISGVLGLGLICVFGGQSALADSSKTPAVEFVAAATPKAGEEEAVNDPIEPLNRVFFQFNEAFQVLIFRPASELYGGLTPPPVKEAVGHFLDNLRTPVILVNDLLQGEGQRAVETVQRFAINTTYGIGGLFDRAEEMGIAKHGEDFGQTLAVWGVDEGFYLVLPFYGPSSPRDAVGKLVVDSFLDPFAGWSPGIDADDFSNARMGLSAADEYSGVMGELAQVKKTSIDYYAAIRSMYRQKRKSEITNGTEVDLPPIPDLDLSYEFQTDEFGQPIQVKGGINEVSAAP
jgi:phospholipid-binding lipoprotein MlaA